ncbi:hypothetical protein RAMLITH_03325 [Ramlibacter sp. RBP-2]|uniref:Restriction endonuclease subunit S n=1 Tax=Ramlibacter lithotrophicus TaxID=2606681 RepID=A0A7X6I504_9BURK|nr:hypothetical protein [Ramlibacter lithotrophicus]NKE64841.1 hypothetical protein [Ramlibacter lithotrophicus]
MTEIQRVLLRDLLTESQNGLSKRSGDEGEATAVLRLADISSGAIDETAPRDILLTSKEVRKYTLRPGDLVCIRVNGSKSLVGRVIPFRSTRKWAYCDHFIRFRPRQDVVDSLYLAHYFQTEAVRRYVELNMVSSAGQNTVSQGTMLDVPVPLLSLADQRLVVAEIDKQFSRLDEAVANLHRVKSNLKRYKTSVLREGAQGRLLGDAQSFECSTFADAGFDLPAGWTWTRVGDIGRLQLGRQRSPKYHAGPDMRPYLRVQNVFEDRIDLSDVMEMNFSHADVSRFALQPGDILLNEGQSPEFLGRPAIYRGELPGACFTNTLIRFQAHTCVVPEFALIVFRHYMHSGRFAKESNITTNIAHLSLGRLSNVEFALPPVPEQQRIVAEVDRRLSIVREVEAEVDANLRRAQGLRQAILAKAFSGAHA